MDRILNVAQRVGPLSDCPNNTSDVQAVQRLLGLLPTIKGLAAVSATGSFDVTTGFYIYFGQVEERKRRPGTMVDGVISPSDNTGNYGGAYWMIMKLNFWARGANRAAWERLLSLYPSAP
jgi:hypothetical protein